MASRPHIAPELIAYLQELYPDIAPDPSIDDRALWVNVGGVRVVRHLKQLFDEQIEHQLGNM